MWDVCQRSWWIAVLLLAVERRKRGGGLRRERQSTGVGRRVRQWLKITLCVGYVCVGVCICDAESNQSKYTLLFFYSSNCTHTHTHTHLHKQTHLNSLIKNPPPPKKRRVCSDHAGFPLVAAHASPPQGISLRSLEPEETGPHVPTGGPRLPAQTESPNSRSTSIHQFGETKMWIIPLGVLCPSVPAECKCSQARPKYKPNMARQTVWHSASVHVVGRKQRSTRGHERCWWKEKWKRSRWEQEPLIGDWMLAQSATMWTAGTGSGVCRDGDMSVIFHRVNRMVLPGRVNTQPHIVISPKYTHTCTVTHS